jgi:gliding motility-associated-like protein
MTLTYPNLLTAPVIADTLVCEGNSVTLNVQGMPVVEWYYSAGGGQPFHYGNSFTTPPLHNPATYFMQSAAGGCRSEMVQVEVLVEDCEVAIPNVFTPNGDGVNDVFTFQAEGIKNLHCKIYNRWGNLIYAWDDILQGWNGTTLHDGRIVSDGVYYYVADLEDHNGSIRKERGYVQVLKN